MKVSSQNRLFKIADSQHGYFTSRQAIESGYQINNHPYYIKQGHWVREHRGIYRLTNFTRQNDDQFALWSLWSTNNKGEVQGVYSFATALSIYDVSDIMPAKLHMTVPQKFRRSSTIPKILILHFDNLKTDEFQLINGYRVTTPIKTLIDIITSDTLEDHLVQQATDEFRQRGMITKRDILMIIEQLPKAARYFINHAKK